MTKKDFEAIAAAIRAATATTQELSAMEIVAEKIAAYCASTNPRFDTARFLAACGVAA